MKRYKYTIAISRFIFLINEFYLLNYYFAQNEEQGISVVTRIYIMLFMILEPPVKLK